MKKSHFPLCWFVQQAWFNESQKERQDYLIEVQYKLLEERTQLLKQAADLKQKLAKRNKRRKRR
jgi:hypothetical protein